MTFAFVNHLSRFYVLNMDKKEAVEFGEANYARRTASSLNGMTPSAAEQYWNKITDGEADKITNFEQLTKA